MSKRSLSNKLVTLIKDIDLDAPQAVELAAQLFKDVDDEMSSCLDSKSISKRSDVGAKKDWLPLPQLTQLPKSKQCFKQVSENDCGLAALQSLALTFGSQCDAPDAVLAHGVSTSELISIANKCGIELKLLWDALKESGPTALTKVEGGSTAAYLMHGTDKDTDTAFAVPLCGSGFDTARRWPSAKRVVAALNSHDAFLILYRHSDVYDEGHYIFMYRDADQWRICDPHHTTPFKIPNTAYAAMILRGAESVLARVPK